jgi:hypothetical protein
MSPPDPATIANTIIAFSTDGPGIEATSGDAVTLVCCDVYGNQGGDWIGALANQYGINGNISADPLFCDPEAGDLTLHEDSPCAPGVECGLMGAWPVACGSTPTVETTWGAIKALYR